MWPSCCDHSCQILYPHPSSCLSMMVPLGVDPWPCRLSCINMHISAISKVDHFLSFLMKLKPGHRPCRRGARPFLLPCHSHHGYLQTNESVKHVLPTNNLSSVSPPPFLQPISGCSLPRTLRDLQEAFSPLIFTESWCCTWSHSRARVDHRAFF